MYEDVYYFANDSYAEYFKGWGGWEYLPPNRNHAFEVQAAGISYCDESYQIYRPNSKLSTIEYIIEGKGYVTHGTQKFTAKKGDVYILHSGYDHKYHSDKDDPWIKIWFNIQGPLVNNIISAYKLELVNHIVDCDIYDLMKEFLNVVKQRKSQKETFDDCAITYLKIIQEISKINQSRNIQDDSIAFRLYELINYCTDYSKNLNDILVDVNCSKEHAIREFKKAYNITPYKYIMQQRMFSAQKMLLNTNLSVNQIADKLNFNDSHYFSAFFKEYTGLSPSAFRKAKTHLISGGGQKTWFLISDSVCAA